MRIENQPRSYGGTPRAVTKAGAAQSGKFQQALASAPREPEDTLTISNRAPVTSDIQPGDSTQVKLAKLQQMAEEADYTGMSYSEIYAAI